MEIRDEHLEWATIDRLSQMLGAPHVKYQVTHSFAFFVPIICWVVQRYRDPERPVTIDGWEDADTVYADPWLASQSLGDCSLSVISYLVGLRNALAHGDHRKVKPVNRNSRLWGYEFACSAAESSNVSRWTGTVQLSGNDMRRIGLAAGSNLKEALQAQCPDAVDGSIIDECRNTQAGPN